MKMRTILITLSCIFGVTLVAGGVCAAVARDEIAALIQGTYTAADGHQVEGFQDRKSAPVYNVDKIKITSNMGELNVVLTDDTQLSVEYRQDGASHKPELMVEQKGDTLAIWVDEGFTWFSLGSWERKLTVFLPRIFMEDLEINVNAGNAKVEALSGLDEVEMTLNAGSLICDGVTAKEVGLQVNAGTLEASNIRGSLDGCVNAGKLVASLADLTGDMEIDVSSGNADITVPSDVSARVSLRASAGGLSTDFPLSTSTEGSHKEMVGRLNGGRHQIEGKVSAGELTLRQGPASSN